MKKPKRILLDMDGVLSNFMGGVSKVFNIDVEKYHSWDVHKVFELTEEQFWNTIHEHNPMFWSCLEPYEWAHYLVKIIQEMSDDIYICTSPYQHRYCYGQKYEWISRYFPEFKERLIITNNKQLLAKPDTILIDDGDSNCKKFYQNGGEYILFPQTWNRNRDKTIERIMYVKKQLGEKL